MPVSFDVIAATNAIATIERTVVSPAPGIIASYDYGQDPLDFDSDQIPAIIHIERGPDTTENGRVGAGIFFANFTIESRVLLIKDVASQPPLEPKLLLAGLYLPLFDLFQTDNAKNTLTQASNAFDYVCTWESPSFSRGDWPIFSDSYKRYWLLRYTHNFMFQNITC